jgi:hypothetical protein
MLEASNLEFPLQLARLVAKHRGQHHQHLAKLEILSTVMCFEKTHMPERRQ